ncbi:UL4 [anatid alphaherpesvirus 1]|uniref:UL4 n=1 Tax=anatid alphaherpesvirus 1 TaxID=104388 RepID=E6Y394_9ALPH|nr:nuclear protein UL4 [Anatid alphaherpesvirus 1]AFC61879.1 UL4 [Anatid alphaherpesvirus 1]AGA17850.1 UL4 [Anatid alphaherpesvirus 1]APQ48449.1 UL4 [Anatid alphaherpesvirus 1]
MQSHPATFITYTLGGTGASHTWTVPEYEQVICSCDGGSRSVLVGNKTRCDKLPPCNVIIQRGPLGTLFVVDIGYAIYSYMLRCDLKQQVGTLSASPGSLYVVPFTSCTVVGVDSYIRSDSSGVLTIAWSHNTVHITITVYGLSEESQRMASVSAISTVGQDYENLQDIANQEQSEEDLLSAAIKEANIGVDYISDSESSSRTVMDDLLTSIQDECLETADCFCNGTSQEPIAVNGIDI